MSEWETKLRHWLEGLQVGELVLEIIHPGDPGRIHPVEAATEDYITVNGDQYRRTDGELVDGDVCFPYIEPPKE